MSCKNCKRYESYLFTILDHLDSYGVWSWASENRAEAIVGLIYPGLKKITFEIEEKRNAS